MEPHTNSTNGALNEAPPTDFAVSTHSAVAAIGAIDAQLKTNKGLTELERAVLIMNRGPLYLATGAKEPAFTKNTSDATGISRAVILRLRRIGRLPNEVRQALAGTPIADRQDLLVQLSDAFEVVTDPVARMELTRQLVAIPPKYGPRTSNKAHPDVAASASAPATEPAVATQIFEGLPIAMSWDDNVPRIFDLELGRLLGYERPRKIRDLIKELVDGGHLVADQRPGAGRGPRTSGHWLTEENALFVTTQSSTVVARHITRQVVRAFVAARHSLINADLVNKIIYLDRRLDRLTGEVLQRLTNIEKKGLRTPNMLLVPQIDPEDAGYSMESMNKYLIEKGYNISPTDTAIRSIAVKLGLIGDAEFGFWNSHSDAIVRGAPLSESWRFTDAGTQAIQPHAQRFCELKMKYEAAGQPYPRETALTETIAEVAPIGNGKFENLTRTRSARRPPFPTIRSPEPAAAQPLNKRVMLTNAGANKIQVIKAIREITGLSLKEAKDLVEAPMPQPVNSFLLQAEAERACGQLHDAGASASIEAMDK